MPTASAGVSLSMTAAAADRAGSWLLRAWAEREVDDAALAVDALALSHVCRLLCGSMSAIADEVQSSVARSIPAPAWASSSLLTGLIAAVGVSCEGSGVTSGAEQYLQLLDELEPESLTGPNGVLLRIALHGAERAAARTGAALDAHRLLATTGRVREFLADIETSSAFGTTIIQVEPPVPILLEGAAVAALRTYDLPLGMRFLRARRYVHDRSSHGLSAGFDFVRSSQCDDGSFGDFDTALAQMAARGDRNAILRLKLPVTLQALWTMAELEEPAFRLIRSAFHGLDRAMSYDRMPDADRQTD
jgi:hypothetical protein